MLTVKELFMASGKWPATLLLGALLVGCSGGGTDNILCGGDCNPGDDPQTTAGGVLGPSDTPPAGIAAADKFSLSVSDFAPADAFDTDGIAVTFTVIVSDQFGNPVDDGSNVNFVSPESGQIEAKCALAAGTCSVTWVSSDPRPADGRVSILAYILRGSEEFGDKNGNFVFDVADGNDFVDLGEACLDENENGICEPSLNEFFVDANTNGILDGGDGVWNGPCFSDYVNAAVCNTPESTVVAESTVITLSTNTVVVQSLGNFPAVGSIIDLNDLAVHAFDGIILSDSNGNALPTGTTIVWDTGLTVDAFEFVSSANNIPLNKFGPTGPFGVAIQTNSVATPGTGTLRLLVTLPDGTEFILQWKTDDSMV